MNNLTPKKHKMRCLNNCGNICRRIMEAIIWDVSISFDEIADCINHCTYNTGRNSSHSLIKIMGFQIEYNHFVFTDGHERFVQEAITCRPFCCIYSCSLIFLILITWSCSSEKWHQIDINKDWIKLFSFSIFRISAYLMKVITETRRVHQIRYLRFY